MIFASLAFAAALSSQQAIPILALRPQDRRADCPTWLVEATDRDGDPAAPDACIWSDTSDAAQSYYVGQLRQAGWSSAGGLANVFKFQKDDACLGIAGFPAANPHSEAIGSDRDLRQPRPAAEAAVFLLFLILPDEPGACVPVGDH